jgi:hypothetical protein
LLGGALAESKTVEHSDVALGHSALGITYEDIAELCHVVAPQQTSFHRVHEVAVVTRLLEVEPEAL